MQFERLHYIVVSPCRNCFLGGLNISIACHKNNAQIGIGFLRFLGKSDTIHLRHFDVGQQEIEFLAGDQSQCFLLIAGGTYFMTNRGESIRSEIEYYSLIIDNQYSRFVAFDLKLLSL